MYALQGKECRSIVCVRQFACLLPVLVAATIRGAELFLMGSVLRELRPNNLLFLALLHSGHVLSNSMAFRCLSQVSPRGKTAEAVLNSWVLIKT